MRSRSRRRSPRRRRRRRPRRPRPRAEKASKGAAASAKSPPGGGFSSSFIIKAPKITSPRGGRIERVFSGAFPPASSSSSSPALFFAVSRRHDVGQRGRGRDGEGGARFFSCARLLKNHFSTPIYVGRASFDFIFVVFRRHLSG